MATPPKCTLAPAHGVAHTALEPALVYVRETVVSQQINIIVNQMRVVGYKLMCVQERCIQRRKKGEKEYKPVHSRHSDFSMVLPQHDQ